MASSPTPRVATALRCALAKNALLLAAALSSTALAPALRANEANRVEVAQTGGAWSLRKAGQPLFLKGAVAPDRFELLKSCGANAVRTGAKKETLDAAARADLVALVGLPVNAQRYGFDWENASAVAKQKEKVLALVRELKDHPAVAAWALGNELDYIPPDEPYSSKLWSSIDDLAAAVKAIDPDHPVITVVGTSRFEKKLLEIAEQCPHLDMLGLNAYGDIAEVTKLTSQLWPKPYLVTEWGTTGHWETRKTRWKAAIEQTSSEKADAVATRYRDVILADSAHCVGSFVFYWSEKQETTHTWYGLFCEGLRTESIDRMEEAWSGKRPANRAPSISKLVIDDEQNPRARILKAGDTFHALVEAQDPDGDTLEYRWDVRPEVFLPADNYAGNKETPAPILQGLVANPNAARVEFRAPADEGAYRLFLTVRDGKGSIAYGNLPFYVTKDGVLPEKFSVWKEPTELGDPAKLGLGIQRTMTLLATSTPEKRNTVRVLFYGQSITEQDWERQVTEDLRARFPNANLVVENRALGGFSSQRLVRTAETDLYSFQPDLLIFHVYGSDLQYEDIIRRTRERTTAEILIQTDHVAVTDWQNESTDPATTTRKDWNGYMNYVFLPRVIRDYGCGYVDQRNLWKRYLVENRLDSHDLLRDHVHLNADGCRLMAAYAEAALVARPGEAVADPMNCDYVTTLSGDKLKWENDALRVTVDGNRIDLIGERTSDETTEISVDGKRLAAHPELYQFSRALPTPGSKWPVIAPVGSEAPLVLETWHLDVERLDDTEKLFAFRLRGSVTGDDGAGRSDAAFRSTSGRITLVPESWDVSYALMLPGIKPVPKNFAVDWQVMPRFVDPWSPTKAEPGIEPATTIASGLSDGLHTLELRGGRDNIRAIRVYSPRKFPVPSPITP